MILIYLIIEQILKLHLILIVMLKKENIFSFKGFVNFIIDISMVIGPSF